MMEEVSFFQPSAVNKYNALYQILFDLDHLIEKP
jgi:hypothetical protein